MTKTEFIQWLQTTTFRMDSDIGGETEVEAHDYTDDEGKDYFKPVCYAFAWNTATAILPDGSEFDVSYQEAVTWPGTFGERFGDYDATIDHGCDDIIWNNKGPTVTEDEDADEEIESWEIDNAIKEHLVGLTDIDYDALIPAITIEEVDMTEAETFTVERDNAPDIRFSGEEIASVSSRSTYNDGGRWTELRLFKTAGGNFVCECVGRTCWQGEHDRNSGSVCKTEEEVIGFFGHGRLAKELYEEAEIVDAVDVE